MCRKYHWEGEEEIGTVIPLAWKFGMKEKADKVKGKCVYIYIYIYMYIFFFFLFTIIFCIVWASQVALVVKNLPANAGDIRDSGLILRLGRSLGGGHGNPLQHSCTENPMDRGAWQATYSP